MARDEAFVSAVEGETFSEEEATLRAQTLSFKERSALKDKDSALHKALTGLDAVTGLVGGAMLPATIEHLVNGGADFGALGFITGPVGAIAGFAAGFYTSEALTGRKLKRDQEKWIEVERLSRVGEEHWKSQLHNPAEISAIRKLAGKLKRLMAPREALNLRL